MKKLFLIPLAALALIGCSNEDMDVNGGANGNAGRFLTVNIVSTPDNAGSRAGGDQLNGEPDEDNALYEEGYSEENDVQKVRFYFFDATGGAASVKQSAGGYVNYLDWEGSEKDGQDMPNVEKKLQATLIINTKAGDQLPAQVVAVINPAAEILNKGNLSLADLRETIDDYAAQVNKTNPDKFVMMNSVYADEGKNEIAATTVTEANYAPSEDAALANPINIYVERTVAKVRVTFGSSAGYSNGRILLKKKLDNGQEENIIVNGKQVYLQVGEWNLTAETDTSYLSKHINANWETNATLFGTPQWNYAPYFRSFWAMNSDRAKQRWHNWNEIGNGGKGYDHTGNQNVIYANENAMQIAGSATQTTGTALEPFTKVIIAGELVDEEGEPIVVTKYAGITSAGEDALIAGMLKSLKDNNNMFYSVDITADSIKFAELTADDVELKTALTAGIDGVTESEKTTGRYYVYLQLTDEAKGKTWTQDNSETTPKEWETVEGERTLDPAVVNEKLITLLDKAQVYRGGKTYYYFPIRHLGNNGTIGYYGVVRNHIYDCTITALTGLGTPVYDPEETIYPEKPVDDDTYIAARINILSWRVVSNDYELNW